MLIFLYNLDKGKKFKYYRIYTGNFINNICKMLSTFEMELTII